MPVTLRLATPEERYPLPCLSRRGGPRSKIFCEGNALHMYSCGIIKIHIGRNKHGWYYSWR